MKRSRPEAFCEVTVSSRLTLLPDELLRQILGHLEALTDLQSAMRSLMLTYDIKFRVDDVGIYATGHYSPQQMRCLTVMQAHLKSLRPLVYQECECHWLRLITEVARSYHGQLLDTEKVAHGLLDFRTIVNNTVYPVNVFLNAALCDRCHQLPHAVCCWEDTKRPLFLCHACETETDWRPLVMSTSIGLQWCRDGYAFVSASTLCKLCDISGSLSAHQFAKQHGVRLRNKTSTTCDYFLLDIYPLMTAEYRAKL